MKFVSLLLIVSFSFSEVAYCAPAVDVPPAAAAFKSPMEQISQDPTRFEAPSEFAALKEIHKGESGTFIIHIQDAHSNLSGQENLAKTLDGIMQKYDVTLVLVEGSSVDGNLDPLKILAPPEMTRQIARGLLIDGQI
ncbi:MAG: hypothetical protein WCG06_00050, partial [Candidatus Omnitrophota bacterium]